MTQAENDIEIAALAAQVEQMADADAAAEAAKVAEAKVAEPAVLVDGQAVAALGEVAPARDPKAAPEAFDVAFNIVKVLPKYWNMDPEAVKRAVRDWQDRAIVPDGLA